MAILDDTSMDCNESLLRGGSCNRTTDHIPNSPDSSHPSRSTEKPRAINKSDVDYIHYSRTGRISKARKGLRVHNCECGRSYTRAEHLRRHQKNHAQDALICEFPECGKAFYRLDLLQRHQERHNEIRSETRHSSIYELGAAPDGSKSLGEPAHILPHVDESEAPVPWTDPLDSSVTSGDSGYASAILSPGDYVNVFANSLYGSGFDRKRMSSNTSTIEPWVYPHVPPSPTSASSVLASTWTAPSETTYSSADTSGSNGLDPTPFFVPFVSNTQVRKDEAGPALLFPMRLFDPFLRLPPSDAMKESRSGPVSDDIPGDTAISCALKDIALSFLKQGNIDDLKVQHIQAKVEQELDLPTAYFEARRYWQRESEKIVFEAIESQRSSESKASRSHVGTVPKQQIGPFQMPRLYVYVEDGPTQMDKGETTNTNKETTFDIKKEKEEVHQVVKLEANAELEATLCLADLRSSVGTAQDIGSKQRHDVMGNAKTSSADSQLQGRHGESIDIDIVICPLRGYDGNACRKRCSGEKRYRSIQEHIRRAHPEHYIRKLPPTEDSFLLMIKTSPDQIERERHRSETMIEDSPRIGLPTPAPSTEGPIVSHSQLSNMLTPRSPSPEPAYSELLSHTTSSEKVGMVSGTTSEHDAGSEVDCETESSTDESDLSSPSTSTSIHSLVISAKTRMIDTFMREVHISLSKLSFTPTSTATHDNSGAGSSQSFAPTSTGSSGGKARGKRKLGDGDGNPPDDKDEEGNSKRRKTSDSKEPQEGSQPIRFACPFFKRNPRAHKRTACRYPGFTGVHRMKEHLYRDHIHIHCHRCNFVFKTDDELREHQRGEPCVVSDRDPPEGINTTQLARLKSKKRFGKERTEEEKWRAIFQYLFPDEDASLVSPYCDDAIDSGDDGNRLTDFELFCRREFTRMVRRELDSLCEQRAQPIEDELRAELLGIVQRCRDCLLPEFERQRRTSDLAPQASGSDQGQVFAPLPEAQQPLQRPPSSLPPLDSGSDTDHFTNSLSRHSSSEPTTARSFMPLDNFALGVGDLGQQFNNVDYEMPQHDHDMSFTGSSSAGDLYMSTVLQKEPDAEVAQYLNGMHPFDVPWDGTSFPYS